MSGLLLFHVVVLTTDGLAVCHPLQILKPGDAVVNVGREKCETEAWSD